MVKHEQRVKENYRTIYEDAQKCKEEIRSKIEAQFADDLLALEEIISHCIETVDIEVPDEYSCEMQDDNVVDEVTVPQDNIEV